MNAFKLINHAYIDQDKYVKEVAIIEFQIYIPNETKELKTVGLRIPYVKKEYNGGHFWSPVTTGIDNGGEKKLQLKPKIDSTFINEDIEAFLESKPWEAGKYIANPSVHQPLPVQTKTSPTSMDEVPF